MTRDEKLRELLNALLELEAMGVSGCDVDCLAPVETECVRRVFMALRREDDTPPRVVPYLLEALASQDASAEQEPYDFHRHGFRLKCHFGHEHTHPRAVEDCHEVGRRLGLAGDVNES